ncbi:MAG: succinate dehydrogenase assembly factor 2 [Nitrosomonadaceae bacterium]|jgi:antitoxin CptB|nr:succinate dehydrogenase assembly factor 2 [Nitrosomonadaceae bacterium]
MKELDRVRWRCRRGMLELDIVLQRFVDKHYTQLNETELQQFDTLLNLPDNDLWDMITAKKEMGDIKLQPMLRLLQID